MEWLAGIGAFTLFFLYDWNRIFWKKRWMTSFFSAGCIILAVTGVLFIWEAFQSGRGLRLLWLIPAAASLCALIYALFFALPFDDTYRKEAAGGRVCRSGLYGYCRHPGILAFFFCFLFLGLAAGERQLAAGMFYSGLNLLYAWYQDRIIFTREFSDYGEYRRDVPFLFPVRGKARQ